MPPLPTYYCGGHLLSHNHQVAVPSARMGLATGIGTVNRAFPHHYHHRKTNQTTTTRQQRANGSSPRTAQRTRTPQCKQPTTPHQGAAHATNEHTQKSHAHTNPKGLMSDRCISTSQLHTSQCFRSEERRVGKECRSQGAAYQ